MISLPRAAARNYGAAYRQLLAGVPRRTWPVVQLRAEQTGLRIAAHTENVGLELFVPGAQAAATLTVPCELFRVAAEGRGENVTVESSNGGGVIVRWRDGDVPRQSSFESCPPVAVDQPELPRNWSDQPAHFLTELHTLMQVTDPDSLRYALHCVQLDGDTGTLTATDGRQILRSGGWSLGFAGTALVPANKVLGHRELATANTLRIGKTNSRFVIQAGHWRVWLALNVEGRFPRVDDLLTAADSAPTRLVLDPDDRRFLQENLPRLPERIDDNRAVTVELNGRVAIRARDSASAPPTELVLNRSSRIGDEVRFCTDRQFLSRALKLGFSELKINSPQQPVACHDDRRTYLWALLESDAALPASEDAIVIESQPGVGAPKKRPTVAEMLRTPPLPVPALPTAELSTPVSRQETVPTTNSRLAETASSELAQQLTPVEQATALRELARTLLAQTNEFVRTTRKQHRELRQLQRELRRRRRSFHPVA